MGRTRSRLQNGRIQREGENSETTKTRWRIEASYQATDERIHGVGEGRAAKNLKSMSRHAQFQHLEDPGRALEGHVQL